VSSTSAVATYWATTERELPETEPMTPTPTTDRRTALKSAGIAALGTSIAGCTQVFETMGGSDTALNPPENHDRRADAALPYPIHGEELPEATVPAALHDREVRTTEFVGDRHVMLTFIFTRCSMSCPTLTSNLVRVQAESIDSGFEGEFAFTPITFDPEHDTADVLAAYGEERGVDTDADNWWFLRPKGPDRAEAVVTDTFGVNFQFVPEDERDKDNMAFIHSNLILLVNADGYVERAYDRQPPNPAEVLTDVQTLRERW